MIFKNVKHNLFILFQELVKKANETVDDTVTKLIAEINGIVLNMHVTTMYKTFMPKTTEI